MFSRRIAIFLTRHHALLLAFSTLLLLVCIPYSRGLDLSWSVEGMFPSDDPLVEAYQKLQQRFGSNDICLAVYRDSELWADSGVGLDRLEQVSEALAKVPGVQSVLSLSEVDRLLRQVKGPFSLFANRQQPPLLDESDALAQALADVFEGYTHRPDSNYVAIACLLESQNQTRVGPSSHQETLKRLEQRLQEYPGPIEDRFITGEPVLVAEGFQMVERDGFRLGVTCSIVVSCVLLACFRSLRWTIIPMAVVHWSLVITKSVLVWLAIDLTMISSTLTSVVTVIGVATSIHFLLRFQEERRHGKQRNEALENSFAALLPPIFWACVTDAVGFSALMVANVGPVRDFGLMMSIGCMSVFVAILVIVPGLALLGRLDQDPSTPRLDWMVRLSLKRLLVWTLARRKSHLLLLGLLLIVSCVGSLRMQVQTDFTKNFRESSPLMRGYSVIEEELGGAAIWDIMLAAPEEITKKYLDAVYELEEALREIDFVGSDGREVRLNKVLSVADAVRAVEVDTIAAAVPTLARLQLMRAAMPDFTGALITQQPDEEGVIWLRVMLRSQEQMPASEKQELIAKVSATLAEWTAAPAWQQFFRSSPPQAEITGYHIMLGTLVKNVLADQWRCFAVASIGVFLVLWICMRSPWLAGASLMTNCLPILMVLGYLGWTDTKANLGVALIAAVSLGLSIDSSIHYLSHYLRRLSDGESHARALQSAQQNVGLAAVLATVALASGFISLRASEFEPTVVFGTLATLTMLGGLLGNLVVLPLLIAPRSRKRSDC